MGKENHLCVRSSMCETLSTIQRELLKGDIEVIDENDVVISTKSFKILVTTIKYSGVPDEVTFVDVSRNLSSEEMEHIKDNT